MSKAACLLLVAALALPAGAQQAPSAAPQELGSALSAASARPRCDSRDAAEVVVCGHSQQKYRIDPGVLAATRAAETPPPKPQLDATAATPCTGANCGGGNYVPLIGMALTALKAAELAADGDDWRDAFRTKPEQYRVYQQEKAKEAAKPRVSLGISAGSSPNPH
jgi:hypothetical protein